MVEALVAIPLILVACMLTIQVMLLYRAKISLNYAAQEAARIGSANNGRLYPRFIPSLEKFIVMGGRKIGNLGATALRRPELPTGALTATDGEKPHGASFEVASTGSTVTAPPVPQTPDVPPIPNANYFKLLGASLLKYGDSSILQGLVSGMVPYYTKGTTFTDILKGQGNAYADVLMNSCIMYHNPTQSAFLDFGFMEMDGPDRLIYQIPNDLMRYRVPHSVDLAGKGIGYYKKHGTYLSDKTIGLNEGLSAMSIQDATLLSIEVKYAAEMKVPIAREILVGLAKLYKSMNSDEGWLGSIFVDDALDQGRWPMSAFATYRMRSPVHWNVFYPIGTGVLNSPTVAQITPQIMIKQWWNTLAELIPVNAANERIWNPAKPVIGFCPGLAFHLIGNVFSGTPEPNHWIGKDYDEQLKKCLQTNNCN